MSCCSINLGRRNIRHHLLNFPEVFTIALECGLCIYYKMTLTFLRHYLIEPHRCVSDPITKQMCRFSALIHAVCLPVPSFLYYMRHDVEALQSAYTPHVHVAGTLAILVSYALLRSPYYRFSFGLQVVSSALIPLLFSLLAPSAHNAPQIIVISLILAAIFFNQRVILWTVGLCNLGLSVLLSLSAEQDLHLIAKTFVTVNMSGMLVYFLRGHQSWLENYQDAALSKQLERYRHLASSSFDGIATLQGEHLEEVSEGFAKVFERSPSECTGLRLTALLPSFSQLDNHIETYAVGLGQNEAVTRYVLLAVNRLGDDRYLLALRDTTKERLAQIKQLQMDRMTATGTLASGIAHELNTPLMVAMNQARIALAELKQSNYRQLERRLGVVDEVLGQIATIVSDLKWYVQSASESERSPSNHVIENAVRLARHRIRQHCRIELELESNNTTTLPDHGMIQLLTNLLFNAADARCETQEYTTIRIRTYEEDGQLVLSVSDDGKGIANSVRQRIFEPFFTHGKKVGSGLGLSICLSLVRRVDGQIDVESELGKGSTFVVRLPLIGLPEDEKAAYEDLDENQTILVVDDDPVLPELIADILADCRCLFAENIDEAQAILKNNTVDAIVCDVNMPCGGARVLYMRLREHNDHLAQRMIVITGGAVNVEMQSFIENTNQPVIYKPFRGQQITEALIGLS